MASIHTIGGGRQEIPLDVTVYRAAGEQRLTVQQYLQRTYGENLDTSAGASVFGQLCAAEGIVLKANRELGFRPSTMDQVLNAGVNSKEAVPASRILFPPVFLQAVEDRLISNLDMTANALDAMIAIDESIDGERYEQPQLNLTKPSQARSQTITQLALPPTMMLMTAADRQYKIPTFGLGLEVSDQALKAFTIDFVAMSVARQIAVQRNERAQQYMLAILNGDVDTGEASLASLGSNYTVNASTLDAASTGGNLTQAAWTKFMIRRATQRTITNIICDVDSLLKIETRANRPTVMTDNPTSPRINTQFTIANPLWPAQVSAFLVVDPAWPANTILGMDRQYGLRRMRNLSATYEAMEAYAMRRSQAMRFDFGEHITRLYNEAFDTLVLA